MPPRVARFFKCTVQTETETEKHNENRRNKERHDDTHAGKLKQHVSAPVPPEKILAEEVLGEDNGVLPYQHWIPNDWRCRGVCVGTEN